MKRYPPAPMTIVFAGIPIGVAYAQLPPMTVAMRTAFGSAPSSVAILKAIGTRSAQNPKDCWAVEDIVVDLL